MHAKHEQEAALSAGTHQELGGMGAAAPGVELVATAAAAAAAPPLSLPRRSCDYSVQGSQNESVVGSSECESLDTWAGAGRARESSGVQRGSLDETRGNFRFSRGGSIHHRGSLDHSFAASTPRHNSLMLWRAKNARSVPHGMTAAGGSAFGAFVRCTLAH